MSKRYLIINADDFGVCVETNEAVEDAFNNGCLTSTTVMTPAGAAEDAIERAKRNPKIKMGLHTTLNTEYKQEHWRSIAPAQSVSSILDSDLFIQHDTDAFYKNAIVEEVEKEIFAQYKFVLSRGYRPTHVDNHCGTVYGFTGKPFYDQVFALCSRYHLPFRLPKNKFFLKGAYGDKIPEEMDLLHTNAVEKAAIKGIPLPDDLITNPFGMKDIPSYEHLKAFYIHVVQNLREGVTELYMHPSKESKTIKSAGWQKRIWEYQILVDDEFFNTLQKEGIVLVNYETAPFKL